MEAMSPTPLQKQCLIIGASISGLAAAAAIAPFFSHITIYDKDILNQDSEPRKSTAQDRHAHQMLAGGLRALEEILPGFTNDCIAAGGVLLQSGKNIKFYEYDHWAADFSKGPITVSMSRPALESLLRRRISAMPNVTIVDQTKLGNIIFKDGRAVAVEKIDGNSVSSISADLIIDGSGLAGRLARQLETSDLGQVDSEVIKVRLQYSSAIFRSAPQFNQNKEQYVVKGSPYSALWAPIENDLWMCSICSRGDTPVPKTLDEFRQAILSLPTQEIPQRFDSAELASEIKQFSKPTSTRRRYDQYATMPSHILPIGDAITSFNPIYGQGMASALMQAKVLRHLMRQVASQTISLTDLSKLYLKQAHDIVDPAWQLSKTSDMAHKTTDTGIPHNADEYAQRMALFAKIAMDKPEMARLLAEVSALVRPFDEDYQQELKGYVTSYYKTAI